MRGGHYRSSRDMPFPLGYVRLSRDMPPTVAGRERIALGDLKEAAILLARHPYEETRVFGFQEWAH